MAKDPQFIALRQLFQRFAFPDGEVAGNQVDGPGTDDKKAAVDPAAISQRFLGEPRHGGILQLETTEASGRTDSGHRRKLAMRMMKIDELPDVDISNAIAIGKTKRVVIPYVRQRPLDATARFGLGAGIDQRHPPRLRSLGMKIDLVVLEIDRDVGGVQEILREILLDQIPFVSKANHELIDAVRRVDLHDVPEHGMPADFHHRLWPHDCLFAQTATEATGEDHHLHDTNCLMLRTRAVAGAPSSRPCARRSNRKYAKLRHGHHQLGLQTPCPKLRRDGLAIMPGEQHHVIRLLANEALVVDHWNMLARQIQTKLE